MMVVACTGRSHAPSDSSGGGGSIISSAVVSRARSVPVGDRTQLCAGHSSGTCDRHAVFGQEQIRIDGRRPFTKLRVVSVTVTHPQPSQCASCIARRPLLHRLQVAIALQRNNVVKMLISPTFLNLVVLLIQKAMHINCTNLIVTTAPVVDSLLKE